MRSESEFCPVTCPIDDLAAEAEACKKEGERERAAFLLGIEHARIFLAAATGGKIS